MTQRFARLEAMLLAKSLAVPLEPVKKPTAVVTSDQPFFDPGAGTSMMSVSQPTELITGAIPLQASGDVAATEPVEAPSRRMESAVKMTATRPVESPGTRKLATQPVEAPGARTDVQSQPTSTGSLDMSAVDQSLTSKRTVADNTGVSDFTMSKILFEQSS